MSRRYQPSSEIFCGLVNLLLIAGVALLSFGGCATAPPLAHPTAPSPAEQLARTVNEWHDSARVADGTPFLFDETKIHDFARAFIAHACPEETATAQAAVSPECNRRFGAAIAGVLHQRYFAADTDSVQAHCRADPLTCEDARTFEVLFRREHNVGIESSRTDKLRRIDDWKSGRIDERALQEALHFRFELSNGVLTTHFPDARAPAGG